MTQWRVARLGRRGDGVAEPLCAGEPGAHPGLGAEGAAGTGAGAVDRPAPGAAAAGGTELRDPSGPAGRNRPAGQPQPAMSAKAALQSAPAVPAPAVASPAAARTAGTATALAALTLPGEVIEGEAEDGRIPSPRIVTPSPERVRAPCPHYRLCGGCALMHASDGFVAAWKAEVVSRALAAQGIEAQAAEVLTSPPRSRRRAVLSGRRTRKGALVGFHARASDVVVDVTDCLVVTPPILAALPALRTLVAEGGTRAGELSLAVTDTPAGLDIAVRGGRPADAALTERLAALLDAEGWARLDWQADGGERQTLTRRPPLLPMGRAQLVPPPGGFLQATAGGEAALQDAVQAITAGARRVADLFAGSGTFALTLAEQAEVHAVEGLADPLAALSAAWRGAPGLRRITTELRDLARRPLLPDELARFDAVVIDPPRAGAEAQARALAASAVPTVAWVSCDPVTFARDARILTAAGYRLGELRVIDQFRWSPHVETVAAFRRH